MKWRICSAALAWAAAVGGCQARDDAPPSPAPSASPRRAQLPVADPPLGREALLLAVLRAATAAALGEDDDREQQNLDNQRFELRMRFGCPGDGAADGHSRGWTYDSVARVVRIAFDPEIESDTPLVQELAGPDVEAVEGFWIYRPWQLRAGCATPQAADAARDDALPGATLQGDSRFGSTGDRVPSLGIAQFFRETDARTHRRDRRAYEAAENLSAREAPSRTGYDLIVQGRLQTLPDGRVIACHVRGSDRPSCVISARFEEVSLERADTGELVAEWPRG